MDQIAETALAATAYAEGPRTTPTGGSNRNIRGVRAPSRPPTREPTLIASVQRALRLLETVGGHLHGATAKQPARAAGLPLGTTCHLLRTLTHEGCLRRFEGKFHFGAPVDGIGRADFRATAHAHPVGRCLLSRPGEDARRDQLDRHPPVELTPSTVTDPSVLLRRLAAAERPRSLIGAMTPSFVL